MKSVKFRMIAIALLSATMPFTAKAQDKVEASVSADFVSNYIWRGTDCASTRKMLGKLTSHWVTIQAVSTYPLQITGSPITKRMADIREITSSMAHIARYTSSKPLWDMILVRWH